MTRIHRSIARRAKTIKAGKTANRGEDYLESYNYYKSLLQNVSGLATPKKIRNLIKKIDIIEREIIRLEDKIDKLTHQRRVKAAKLEEEIEISLSIARDYLDPDEYKDFRV